MFPSSCTATAQDTYYDNCNFLFPKYVNVRTIDMDEIKNYNNNINIFNATFLDDGKYYNTLNINNISEKEAIMKIAEKEKVFGKEENNILNSIIEKNIVETKNNFFDYYD